MPSPQKVRCAPCNGTGYFPDPREALAHEIRDRRRRSGWSLEDVNRMTGIKAATVWAAERAQSSITAQMRIRALLMRWPVKPEAIPADVEIRIAKNLTRCADCKGKGQKPDARPALAARAKLLHKRSGWTAKELKNQIGASSVGAIYFAEAGSAKLELIERLVEFLEKNPRAPAAPPPARLHTERMTLRASRRKVAAPVRSPAKVKQLYSCSVYGGARITVDGCRDLQTRALSACGSCRGVAWRVRRKLEDPPVEFRVKAPRG